MLVNGSVAGSVTAGLTQYVDTTASSLTLSFTLNRPTLAGRELGDPMAGVFCTIPNPSGAYNFTVDNVIGQQAYFEPLVTNNTAIPLVIEVNGGLEAQNRCDWDAPAGTSNVAGCYRLFSNGNIRFYRGDSSYTGPYWFWGTDSNGFVSGGGPLPGYADALTGRARFTAATAPNPLRD